jgi:hypothetical protein
VRTAVETWNRIIALLTAPNQAARSALEMITNVVAMLVAEEYTRNTPIVVLPATGPRIRIYTVHGPAAVGTDDDAASLATWPLVDSGWRLSFPCGIDDIDEVRAALRRHTFVEVRDATERFAVDSEAAAPRLHGSVSINYDELERP